MCAGKSKVLKSHQNHHVHFTHPAFLECLQARHLDGRKTGVLEGEFTAAHCLQPTPAAHRAVGGCRDAGMGWEGNGTEAVKARDEKVMPTDCSVSLQLQHRPRAAGALNPTCGGDDGRGVPGLGWMETRRKHRNGAV